MKLASVSAALCISIVISIHFPTFVLLPVLVMVLCCCFFVGGVVYS